MGESKMTAAKLKPIILAFLVMLMAAGCSSANLGDIDETLSERDDMPGPGIFADEDGENTLKWSTKVEPSDEKPAQSATKAEATTGIEPEQSSATAIEAAPVTTMDDKAEFEAFKKWNRLRSEGANSAEYQEFLLWLEYQQFKN